MMGSLRIIFQGERGTDAGGLTREWFLEISKAMLNPNYSLFEPTQNGNTFQPSSLNLENNWRDLFKFIGRVIGKSIISQNKLDAYFTRSFYKHMLGQPLTYHDMEDIDQVYFKSLKQIKENAKNIPV